MTEPPKILRWLLDKVCPDSLPDIKGDFLELYNTRVFEKSRAWANRRLLLDTVSIIKLNFIVARQRTKTAAMFSTYLKIAKRNLAKNKIYTVINVVGLSVSLTMCILITLFVRDELSFDTHFEGGDEVYRIAGNYSQGGPDRVMSAQTTYLVKPLIENDVAGLESVTRADFTSDVITVGDKQYSESKIVFADSTFFDVFKIPFLRGDVSTALDRPENVVVDRIIAEKYFGTADVLGKTIELREKQFVITGVFQPLPKNTHFECHIVFPIPGVRQWYADWILTNASGTSLYTYIRTKVPFSVPGFEAALTKQVEKGWGWKNSSGAPRYFLQRLKSIHLNSHFSDETGTNGSMTIVYVFSATAIIIFILAFINFINLTTAASFQRGKEVGVKKVLGSSTRMQMTQFQTESFIVAIIAMVFAMIIARLTIPVFNQLSGKALSFNPFLDGLIGPGLLLVVFVLGLVAGAAPALVLLRTSMIGMLTDRLELRSGKSYVRSALVIFQFAISTTLVACTLIVMDQINFIRKSDLGIDPESVVLIPLPSNIVGKYELMRTELMRNASVISVSASSNKTTERVGTWRQYKTNPTQQNAVGCPSTAVSVDFFETLKAKMLSGRTFSREHATDVLNGYILNESAVKFLGIEDPIGKNLNGTTFTGSKWFVREGEIIGVVKDFHYSSLHDKVQPVIFYLASEQTETYGWIEVRISTNNIPAAIRSLETAWTSVVGDRPFEFEFMDHAVANHYEAENRFFKIFTTFSVLSIMLGALGLFGLTAFMTKRRTKEIGIRRVMGASVPALVRILSSSFLRLVLIANFIGWPITWYFMNSWLTGFAYRVNINPLIFLLTCVSVLLIAFICILYHALKVSNLNPVKSLRNE